MVDQGSLEEHFVWEDVTAFKSKAGNTRRISKSPFESPAVGRPLTSQIPELSNHDRIQDSFSTNESRLVRREDAKMAGTVRLNSKMLIALKTFGQRERSDSFDEEFIHFPSYEGASECHGAGPEGLCIQRSTSESDLDSMSLALALGTVDDTFLHHRPTMHVDYLSHDWLEEDIWASWKHLVSRREKYSNGPRLVNASWRTWAKTRSNLRTIPPESIKWVKDLDVTWLYGPLQPGRSHGPDVVSVPARMVDSGISLDLPKPILRIPSLCELLLQRSLSNISISRQSKPAIDIPESDSSTCLPRRTPEKANTFSMFSTPSRASSIRDKSVRFHDEVVQCISIDIRDDCVLDEEDITYQNLNEVECDLENDTGYFLSSHQITKRLDALRTIELLAPTRLKAEAKPRNNTTSRAKHWPNRNPSHSWDEALLPSPSTRIKDDDEMDWISPVPREAARSQILDKYLNDTDISTLSDEELFEIEMFGSIQRDTVNAKIKRSLFTPLYKGEEVEIHSSPSLSDCLSSGSDELSDEDFAPFIPRSTSEEKMNFQPTSTFPARSSLGSQRLPYSQPPNDLKTPNHENTSRFVHDPFNSKDRDTASPRFQPSPSFELQQPNASLHASQFEESVMDDEDHWWMNI